MTDEQPTPKPLALRRRISYAVQTPSGGTITSTASGFHENADDAGWVESPEPYKALWTSLARQALSLFGYDGATETVWAEPDEELWDD